MDIGDTIAPKSDQQNFDDYIRGPRTVTVSGVKVIKGEQPVHLELAEYPGRPYKPNKSMRRVLVAAWGDNSQNYVGRQLTLFGNPTVMYAGKEVGGVEISHMSHLKRPLLLPMTRRRGVKEGFTVYPLPTGQSSAPAAEPEPATAEAPTPAPPTAEAPAGDVLGEDIAKCQSVAELQSLHAEYRAAGADEATLHRIRQAAEGKQ